MRTISKFVFASGAAVLAAGRVIADSKFPPPDFTSGYVIPETSAAHARFAILEYLDVAVLAACLGMAVWLIYRKRSRRGLFRLSIFSLLYFGFYRKGCVCAIGSPQNIIYSLFHSGYAAPLTVIAFFVLPLIVTLFAGRAFCAGVCPHGAIQDFLLIKPVKVPAWLEHGLGMLPFVFLGAGLVYAATGTGFVICRYDPFVPIFRLSGSLFILLAGGAFLLTSLFVGRPYCRFLCPYGGLLRMASLVSKWRVRVTPDVCTKCRLCEHSCPFGAMREPTEDSGVPVRRNERFNLGWMLALLPALIALGALAGGELSDAASKLHPGVALAERYIGQQSNPIKYEPATPEARSLARASQDPGRILEDARELKQRFKLATELFGAWVGLVFGVKLISLSIRIHRDDFEPDRGSCLACARCFSDCPNERTRLGALSASPMLETAPAMEATK